MRSHAAAPNPMNHASPTLEWSPTTALCGRLLKAAASMSRLSLNALSACADDARKTREIVFVEVLTLLKFHAEGVTDIRPTPGISGLGCDRSLEYLNLG
jgi:hypothetical protein